LSIFLTPWSRVLFEKLIVAQVVKKYPHLLMVIYLKIYYHVHNSLLRSILILSCSLMFSCRMSIMKCPVAGFGMSGVEQSGSVATVISFN
jgi:hypothetical protein